VVFVEVKVELVCCLVDSGFCVVELISFVYFRWVL